MRQLGYNECLEPADWVVSRKESKHRHISDWAGENPAMTYPRLRTVCAFMPQPLISVQKIKVKHNLHIWALACACIRWVQIWNGISQFPLAAPTIYPSISTAPRRLAFPPPSYQSSHSHALWKWEEKLHLTAFFIFYLIPLSLFDHPSIHLSVLTCNLATVYGHLFKSI